MRIVSHRTCSYKLRRGDNYRLSTSVGSHPVTKFSNTKIFFPCYIKCIVFKVVEFHVLSLKKSYKCLNMMVVEMD